jgi:hypothetical protein
MVVVTLAMKKKAASSGNRQQNRAWSAQSITGEFKERGAP